MIQVAADLCDAAPDARAQRDHELCVRQESRQRGHREQHVSAEGYNNLGLEKGRASTDMRRMFNLAAVWQITYYKGSRRFARQALNGWQISPIVTLRSGLPMTILNGVDANLDGNGTDRAQLIGNPHLANPSAAEWFNSAAFAENPIFPGHPVDGNSGRNTLDAPGLRDADLALARTFHIAERVNLQFRAEGSNAFNIVSLGTPVTTVSLLRASASFGARSQCGRFSSACACCSSGLKADERAARSYSINRFIRGPACLIEMLIAWTAADFRSCMSTFIILAMAGFAVPSGP